MAEQRDNGGPAFPQTLTVEQEFVGSEGLSLRDYFAAQALARIGAKPELPISEHARLAYEVADAMIAERKK